MMPLKVELLCVKNGKEGCDMSISEKELFKLLGKFESKQKMPPIENWHPTIESEIDIKIDSQGRWFHEGGYFERQDLARLFASILITENGQYFLITPSEKIKIVVEDVPFNIVLMDVKTSHGQQEISFITSLGDEVTASKTNPIEFRQFAGDWVPYVEVRNGLWGRVVQSVYYELMNLVKEAEVTAGIDEVGTPDKNECYYLESAGETFEIPAYQ